MLEEILVEILEEGQNTCVTPEIRENTLLEMHSDGNKEISQRLQEILKTFCSVIETLAFQRCDEVSFESSGMMLPFYFVVTKFFYNF